MYLDGSGASKSQNTAGAPVCVIITLTDGLVLARPVFEIAIHYASAVICGQPETVAARRIRPPARPVRRCGPLAGGVPQRANSSALTLGSPPGRASRIR